MIVFTFHEVIVCSAMNKVNKKSLTTPQFGVVTLAVYLLDGHQRAVDTEDVAVKAHGLAPGRFCWRKYPDQINMELVRAALSDAKKSKNGAWVTGVGRTGWSLTPEGLRWVKANLKSFSKEDFSRRREESRAGSVDENSWRRERSRILGTDAWRKWMQSKASVTRRDAEEVFRIDNYSTGPLKNRKITRVADCFADDPEIAPFIRKIAKILAVDK
jgi:hypothetical protein